MNISMSCVLILVFVEFTLREPEQTIYLPDGVGLNPCFCGIYSQRALLGHLKSGSAQS